MEILTPRNAIEALRLAKTAEAASKMEANFWWNGDGTATVDSWKTNPETGKRYYDRYEINLNAWTCNCPNFKEQGHYCKHLLKGREIEIEEQQEREAQEIADGEAFMQNLWIERSLR